MWVMTFLGWGFSLQRGGEWVSPHRESFEREEGGVGELGWVVEGMRGDVLKKKRELSTTSATM